MIDETIRSIWRSDWSHGFNCEAREWLGECDGEFYFAFEISPAEDEQLLDWSGPYATRAEARVKVNAVCERWEQRMDQLWEDWEQRQIAEFEAR
jgi:hypothetical protein